MPSLHFVFPGNPDTPTGGFAYDRRMVAALRDLGIAVEQHCLGDGFPAPDTALCDEAAALLARIPDGANVVIDGLAFGVLPEVLHTHARRLRLVALVHHPLADETGLDPARERRLFESEKDALALASQVVAVSQFVAARLQDFGVPTARIAVVPAGVDAAPLARGSDGGTIRLLCVATLTARKGHAVLLDSLASLLDRPWRLVCVGSDTRDPATASALYSLCDELGLTSRITFKGALDHDALGAEYAAADALVLASHYEGFGLVLGEAIARGLPVIATKVGGTPEAVPRETALFVPPDDRAALAEALAAFMDDAELRTRLRAAARAARAKLPSWRTAARRFANALGLRVPA